MPCSCFLDGLKHKEVGRRASAKGTRSLPSCAHLDLNSTDRCSPQVIQKGKMEHQAVPTEGLRQRTAHTAEHDTPSAPLSKSSMIEKPAQVVQDDVPLGKTPDGTGERLSLAGLAL